MVNKDGFRLSWIVTLFWCIVNAPLGASQDLASVAELLPDCALPCLSSSFKEAACNLTAVPECLCPNTRLQADVSDCVRLSCAFNDQITVSALTNKLCTGYPIESRSDRLVITSIACAAITFPIVVLRCIARLKVTSRLWWDDWTALIATVFLAGADLGLGRHYWNLNTENAQTILQLIYAFQILYILIQVSAKGSLLAFYRRIFPNRRFQIAVWAGLAFLLGHGIVFLCLIIFQCRPIDSIWNRNLEGKCLNITAIVNSGAALSIVEDIAFLVMPIPELLKLQLGTRKRAALLFIFSIGSFACVTSMIRLKYLVNFDNSLDETWDYVNVIIWSVIELSCALACASLPAVWPLVKKIPGILSTVTGSRPRDTTDFSNRESHIKSDVKVLSRPQNRGKGGAGRQLYLRDTNAYLDMESSSKEDFELQTITKG
ncbi:hypothetical protein BKA56DRAFT_557341 [Ilyonectria sp. MPI-CAGE-AT-0026]|nr:hypothetical protein BKA56DRAFT_557341 [Ilyonectria sp. MPI-CAGE-AT-0026]